MTIICFLFVCIFVFLKQRASIVHFDMMLFIVNFCFYCISNMYFFYTTFKNNLKKAFQLQTVRRFPLLGTAQCFCRNSMFFTQNGQSSWGGGIIKIVCWACLLFMSCKANIFRHLSPFFSNFKG